MRDGVVERGHDPPRRRAFAASQTRPRRGSSPHRSGRCGSAETQTHHRF
jgi:hypothetical protein